MRPVWIFAREWSDWRGERPGKWILKSSPVLWQHLDFNKPHELPHRFLLTRIDTESAPGQDDKAPTGKKRWNLLSSELYPCGNAPSRINARCLIRAILPLSLVSLCVSALCILFALSHWPRTYYLALRWIISCASFGLGWCSLQFADSYRNFRCSALWIAVGYALTGVLFAPFASFNFSRNTWEVLDLLTAIWFLLGWSSWMLWRLRRHCASIELIPGTPTPLLLRF